MTHLALLRGVNVGGKNKVPMADLRLVVESLGLERVATYINSGNVVFDAGSRDDAAELTAELESAIERTVGFRVDVLLWDRDRVERLVGDLPEDWVNDRLMRCDVIFLWPEVDRPSILEQVPRNPEVDQVRYSPGALFWRIDRSFAGRSWMTRLIGTDVYRRMTIRNATTVRTLLRLLREADTEGRGGS
jgi:uncharacterized protein (DUF1697 family)